MLRDAIRSLRRSPGFTLVAIASLGVGLGANTALFSILNALVLRPLPFREVGRLVDVSEHHPTELCAGCAVGASQVTFHAWRDGARSFSGLEGYLETPLTLGARDEVARISGALVSGGLLDLLGVLPEFGRTLHGEDDRPGAPAVAVLSHRLWQGSFGADPEILNTVIRLNGAPHVVVGVMPRRFGFPELAQVWVPIAGQRDNQPADDRSLGVVGRLADGVSADAAQAEVAGLSAVLGREWPVSHGGWTAVVNPIERPLEDTGANTGVALGLAAAGFVLLITCANLANLLLARGTVRRREFAVRAAVGAGRGALVRAGLTESVLTAVLGGGLGLLIGLWLVQAILLVIGTEIPVWIDLSFDWRVFTFAAVLAVVTGVVFGLPSALDAGRTDVQSTLRAGAQGVTRGRGDHRLRNGLVVAQISLALALLTGTGMVVHSYLLMSRTNPLRADPDLLLRGDLQLVEPAYENDETVRALGVELAERLASIPGVVAASVAHAEFLGAFVGSVGRIFLEGQAEARPVGEAPRFALAVTPGYFPTHGLRVLRGRGIGAGDVMGAPRVAVVNETASALLWPGQEAIGRRFSIDGGTAGRGYEVVGVARDEVNPFSRQTAPLIYTAFAQGAARPLTAEIRSTIDPRPLVPAFREAVRAVDSQQPIDNLLTGRAFSAIALAPVRFMSAIMGTLGLLALLLSAFGLYSMLAFRVARSTRELGIRMTLGAIPGDLVLLVLRRGGRLVGVAFLIGLPLAFGMTRLVRAVVFGVAPPEPLVLAVAPIVLTLVALTAAWLPARRAVRVNPVEALRSE